MAAKIGNVIRILKRHEREIRGLGARALYLFGSSARGTARSGSDVDLFIDYDGRRKFSLVDLVRLKYFLEEILARDVDLTTRDGLHRAIRKQVESEAVKVY